MAIIPIVSSISELTVGRNLSVNPIVRSFPMEGFITKRHFVAVWRVFGFRMALRVLTAKPGTTFLQLVANN